MYFNLFYNALHLAIDSAIFWNELLEVPARRTFLLWEAISDTSLEVTVIKRVYKELKYSHEF